MRWMGAGWLIVALLMTEACAADRLAEQDRAASPYLTGQLLVATPRMGDPRFSHTVIYVIAHDRDGAMGVVVNRMIGEGPLKNLLEVFGVDAGRAQGSARLHYGGPVEQGRGLVLHSADYKGPSTTVVDDGVALSTGLDVLNALAADQGPKLRLLIIGYAGWAPGQLEGEIARDDWRTAPAEESLIFGDDVGTVWERAFRQAGIAL